MNYAKISTKISLLFLITITPHLHTGDAPPITPRTTAYDYGFHAHAGLFLSAFYNTVAANRMRTAAAKTSARALKASSPEKFKKLKQKAARIQKAQGILGAIGSAGLLTYLLTQYPTWKKADGTLNHTALAPSAAATGGLAILLATCIQGFKKSSMYAKQAKYNAPLYALINNPAFLKAHGIHDIDALAQKIRKGERISSSVEIPLTLALLAASAKLGEGSKLQPTDHELDESHVRSGEYFTEGRPLSTPKAAGALSLDAAALATSLGLQPLIKYLYTKKHAIPDMDALLSKEVARFKAEKKETRRAEKARRQQELHSTTTNK